jgi:hypothetical protein
MTSRFALRFFLFAVFLVFALVSSAVADTSHARIIRLSYVQGDVRIAHNVSGDSLQSGENAWEAASLNIPIHQRDALATDNGRAEVEFESGTVVFLAENTVLEFYDLSLEDGEFTTRLILRQGSASFSVRPGRGDYFSVTGGDFSVEANEKAYFRVNNYDDGSDVRVFQGHISVLSKGKTTTVWKGQSLSMRAADPDSVAVESAANKDEFDQWTSGRIESGHAALTASQQYSGVYDYTSGFGDLYTFGGWYSVAGYGYCWRPYGVSFGWNPFQFGRWVFDPFFGNWVFIGGQPWGWLPYHYGSWVFQPGLGWVWTPTGAFPYSRGGAFGRGGRGTGVWKPVTATWVRSGSNIALVPTHPLDEKGKTPVNIREGVFPVSGRGVSDRIQVNESENWKSFKNSSRDSLPTESASTAAPARVVRTMAAGESSPGTVLSTRREAGIEFDPVEHRFVNSGRASSDEHTAAENRSASPTAGERQVNAGNPGTRGSDLRRASEGNGRATDQANSRGSSAVPPRMTPPPTPPPASSGARAGGYSGAGSSYGGGGRGASSGGSSAGSSGSSRSSAGGSSSSSPSAGSSHPASSSSGSSGGRPH